MRVAIVHDWITSFSGAERVVLELHKMYPSAPIYTSVYNPDRAPQFAAADIRTSFIQKIPLANKYHQYFSFLRRITFKQFDFSNYDVVISSSGAEAKSIRTGKDTLHINYCHAPTHYYWSRYDQYTKSSSTSFMNSVAKLVLKATIRKSRRWDYLAAQQPDIMIANSNHIAREIQKYYDREATVIHPPVDLGRFEVNSGDRNGFVIVGRQTHYKRIDLAVVACTELAMPLVVVGHGPQHEFLKSIAGPTIKFVTDASDEDVAELISQAEAFIFPGLDDFGIVAIEAMAAGTPIIAYKAGGSLDYIDSRTGVFFDHQTPESLIEAIEKFDARNFPPKKVAEASKEYSLSAFTKKIKELVTTST